MNDLRDLLNLSERTSLVTGASGHLGMAICHTLAELGSNLIIVDRVPAEVSKLASSLSKKWNVRAEGISCDLELPHERLNLVDQVLTNYKGLNCLINNAAFIGTDKIEGWNVDFKDQSSSTFSRALEVNLIAAFDLSKSFAQILSKSGDGVIINIASIYGISAPDWELYKGTDMSNPAAYGASKAGLIQLTKWLASTLAPNIRVNSISPGGILRDQPKEFVERYILKTPLGRMANESDIQGAIAYLASDMSKYVTGQNLVVDGGWGII
jgi:NAD(P)-dependent dehydrogenase (short-subunit alcohol dehydrogenase family)